MELPGTAAVVVWVLTFTAGLSCGRIAPRRGRHAAPRTQRGREKLAELTRSRTKHPAAAGNVVIDLRAWVPTDEQVAERLAQTPDWPSIKIINPVHD
jgi:hypothetical protein